MTGLESLQQQCAVDLAAVSTAVERLRAGDVYVDLIEDRIEIRAANLAAVLQQVADAGLKLIWTGNPLRSPLTIERLILQAAGPEADLRLERTPEQLAHMLTLSPDPALARLIIVQQPETLDPVARETLARMHAPLAKASPRVQMLFCGTSVFHPIAAAQPAPPGTMPALLPPLPEPIPAVSRREVVPLLVLLGATTVGSFWAAPIKPDHAPALLGAATIPPTQPSMDIAALRREFDLFLAEQPSRVSNLTPAERDTLFEEYLVRARKSPADQRL